MATDLICYVYEGWEPWLRPAGQRRDWMDDSPESFAYRCLPLGVANAHGWELLSPCAFEAEWSGGDSPDDVAIYLDGETAEIARPVSLFGLGTVTFHVPGLFRTSPGWSLWVGGPANAAKDGIAALSGVIETDWSPYTFTMNWRFTRPHQRVRFEVGEPISFFFPVQPGVLEEIEPKVAPMAAEPELTEQFEAWSRSRDAFQRSVIANPPARPSDKWQKLYYRGVSPDGKALACAHRVKLRLKSFEGARPIPEFTTDAGAEGPGCPNGKSAGAHTSDLDRRDWLLRTRQRLRSLSKVQDSVPRLTELSPDSFLDHFYAANRPVVLGGVASDWPALQRWSPEYLAEKLGGTPIEVQAGPAGNEDYEPTKVAHRTTMPFGHFIEALTPDGGDLYITAIDSAANAVALAPIYADLGRIDPILDSRAPDRFGFPWIGGASFTPLHHELSNNLLVQIAGRKEVILIAPDETPNLYNDNHVFSRVRDITDPALDRAKFPLLSGARFQRLTLEPGDGLFLPVGWWYQARSRSFSASITYTNFIWPNDFSAGFRV